MRSCTEHDYYHTLNHSFVDFNVTSLYRTYKNVSSHTQEISVLIVDFALPEINGIELCKKLRHLPCKKILLTGEADHRDAVEAFNDNIIDRFIKKDSTTLVADIQLHISTLMKQYFRERTKDLLSHLEVDNPLPLTDPIFIEFFNQLCSDTTVKEYFLIDKQGSFILIHENNQISFFILHTDRTLNSFVELHDDVCEAKYFIERIRNREKIPFFGIGKESWNVEPTAWENYFYSPEMLKGRDDYYWKILPENHSTLLTNLI